MKRILNLGAGTQSSVLLLMADRGEIEPIDVAVFADTGWEPAKVYEHLEWVKAQVKIPVEIVSSGNILDDALTSRVGGKGDGVRWASMPFFVKGPNGEKGMIRRQCTLEYKIKPIEQWIKREVLQHKKHSRLPTKPVVEQVFGISFDERQRMRKSTVKWSVFSYPLVEMGWRRQRVIQWAAENYPERVFPRSACVGCPYRSDESWQEIKDGPPDEWQSAVELDRKIRNANGMEAEVFLHASRIPLEDIDFRSRDNKNGQLSLLDECSGMCGV